MASPSPRWPWFIPRGPGSSSVISLHPRWRWWIARGPTISPTLPEAIVAFYGATGSLAGYPIWDYQSRQPDLPFATFCLVSAVPEYNLTDGYYEDVLVQFSVFATTDLEAYNAGQLIKSAFKPKKGYAPLQFSDGYEMIRLPGNEHLAKADGRTKNNENVWQFVIEFTWTVGRTF